jgi:predicted transcriptional regulator
MRSPQYKPEDLQASAWRAAFKKVNQSQAEVIPPGWHTPDEIAEKLGYCKEVAMQKCREMAKVGMVERRDFKVAWGHIVRPRPHYRLVNNPARGRKPG